MSTRPRLKWWSAAAVLGTFAGCGRTGLVLDDVSVPDASPADAGPPPVDAGTEAASVDAGTDAGVVDATPPPLPATYAAHTVAAPTDGGTGVAFFTFDEAVGFAPEGTLTLSASGCQALAFDAQRDVYVACSASADAAAQPTEVLVFASGSWNDTPPIRVITAPLIGSSTLGGIAVDSAGNVYVAAASVAGDDAGPNDSAIVVFGPSSDSTPIRVIQALGAPLESVNGVAIDSSENVWVLCPDAVPLRQFAAGANGRVAPILTLLSPSLDLPDFGAIAIGTTGRVWLTSSNRIAWYSTSPSVTYGGDVNDSDPVAIAADDVGDVFVLTGAGEIQAFNGSAIADPMMVNPVPEATVSSAALDVRSGVAVSP